MKGMLTQCVFRIFVRAAMALQEPTTLLQHSFYFIADVRTCAINAAIYFIAHETTASNPVFTVTHFLYLLFRVLIHVYNDTKVYKSTKEAKRVRNKVARFLWVTVYFTVFELLTFHLLASTCGLQCNLSIFC